MDENMDSENPLLMCTLEGFPSEHLDREIVLKLWEQSIQEVQTTTNDMAVISKDLILNRKEVKFLVTEYLLGDIFQPGSDERQLQEISGVDISNNSACCVCGDNSSVNHFQLIFCEDCINHFCRSEQGTLELTSNQCEIIKQTKEICQVCRFWKSIPSGCNSTENVTDKIIPIRNVLYRKVCIKLPNSSDLAPSQPYTSAALKHHKCLFCQKMFLSENELEVHEIIHKVEKLSQIHNSNDLGYKSSQQVTLSRAVENLQLPVRTCLNPGRDGEVLQLQRIKDEIAIAGKHQVCIPTREVREKVRIKDGTHPQSSLSAAAKQPKCQFCQEVFLSESELEVHERIHMVEKHCQIDKSNGGQSNQEVTPGRAVKSLPPPVNNHICYVFLPTV